MYEPERIAFARRLVATTYRFFTVVTRPGAVARLVRTRLVPRVFRLLARLTSVRRFLFRNVSQIGVNYRNGPLSAGAAGGVPGGDRRPWVEVGGGDGQAADNFAPLESLRWQVHCYGEASPSVRDTCAAKGLERHAFPWQAAMGRAGLRKNALYLVRPDGYVGLAEPSGDASTIERYLEAHAFRPAGPREATAMPARIA
jgi:hypothetical protein